MKKTSLTLLSLLALSGPAFGQVASDLVAPNAINNGFHNFMVNGTSVPLKLCTYELCHEDENGLVQVDFVATGSAAAVIAQASEAGAKKHLVFYPAGKEGDPDQRRVLRNRYLVRLAEGANLEAIKNRCGMQSIKMFSEGSNIAICEEESSGRVLSQLVNVLSDPQISSAEPILARRRDVRVVPTDPFYAPNTFAEVNSNYQWYLDNEGVNGGVANIDINVEDALGIVTGAGVTVSIVDEGVAIDHEDLVRNTAVGPHLNLFGDAEPDDPATFDPFASHGTSVAGLIGAAFNNGEGMSGVAPDANLSGIRLLPGADTSDRLIDDLEESQALGFALDEIDISNNSWGPLDSTLDFAGPGPLVLETFRNGVTAGRGGLGTIYVWSGGNGGDIFDRVDYDGYANSMYTIAVGAIDDSGRRSGFSEEGASLVVTAPSSGGSQGIVTTEFGTDFDDDGNLIRTSEYTYIFGGTSASAPLVSGVTALMLEANPNLNWRDVQDVLMRSAVMVDPNDGDWITNAAGLNFNHKYGAGLVDATAAVQLAQPTSGRAALGTATNRARLRVFSGNSSDAPNNSGVVPDNDGSSLLVTYDMSVDNNGAPQDNLRVEHVELRARVITESRTDLEIVLISPSGTQSVLQTVDEDNEEESITNWTFMTVRNWGEGSAGTWTIRVTDRITGNPAILQNATLTIHGAVDASAPVSQAPVLTSATSVTVNQGEEFNYTIESQGATSVSVGDLPQGASFDPATNTISGSVAEAGLFNIPIALTDALNVTGTFDLRLVVRPTAVALGDAVGLNGIPAVFEGDAPWDFEFTQTNSNGPGEDETAASSAVGLEDGQSSSFGFDNLGSGVLMFDWRTSSEAGADRLWFNRGGEVPQVWDAFIDGSREWTTSAVILPESSNNVRWIYAKDASFFPTAAGEDRGLVDNVELIEMDRFLQVLLDAGPITGFDPEFDGRTIFYPKTAIGASPAPGGTEPVALASPGIGNGQAVSIAGWVEGPGTFNATAIVYAHESDSLEVLIDGVVMEEVVGNIVTGTEFNMRTIEKTISEGRHRVELRFRKDFSVDAFGVVNGAPFEGVILDDISFVADGSFAAFLAAIGTVGDDGDGHSLFEEYAFGGDPNLADTPRYLPAFVTGADGQEYLEYGFDTSLSNLDYTAQQSSNLVDWVDVDTATLDRSEGDVEVFRVPVSGVDGSPRLYFRVSAEER